MKCDLITKPCTVNRLFSWKLQNDSFFYDFTKRYLSCYCLSSFQKNIESTHDPRTTTICQTPWKLAKKNLRGYEASSRCNTLATQLEVLFWYFESDIWEGVLTLSFAGQRVSSFYFFSCIIQFDSMENSKENQPVQMLTADPIIA